MVTPAELNRYFCQGAIPSGQICYRYIKAHYSGGDCSLTALNRRILINFYTTFISIFFIIYLIDCFDCYSMFAEHIIPVK